MVKITQVHTGGGDGGESSLVDGSRHSKANIRFEMVGTCDELNSIIGICLMEISRLDSHHGDGGKRSNVPKIQNLANLALSRIQSELFDLGAELACPADSIPEFMELIGQHQSDVLLSEMQEMLEECERSLATNPALSGAHQGLLDFASLPFIRQFRIADPHWFDSQTWPHLHQWLQGFLTSARFASVMEKYSPWQPGEDGVTFPVIG